MMRVYIGLGIVFLIVGCTEGNRSSEGYEASSQSDAEHGMEHGADPHSHASEGHGHGVGPHQGTIVDWGGGVYHVEFTVDHELKEATVFVFGKDEKTPSPIEAASIELSIRNPELQLTLPAAPQDGDPEGKASRFAGSHESLGIVQEFSGTITGVVAGTPYSGDFVEEPHLGHDH
ncbi:MAG: hypothetical protein KDB03_18925 [Planctomycetales bacterium]|nr:hypothetical protein [Planctomycetales bacterium]